MPHTSDQKDKNALEVYIVSVPSRQHLFISNDRKGTPADEVVEAREQKENSGRNVFQLKRTNSGNFQIFNPTKNKYLFVSNDELGKPTDNVVEARANNEDDPRTKFKFEPYGTSNEIGYLYNISYGHYLFLANDKLGTPADNVIESRKTLLPDARSLFQIVPTVYQWDFSPINYLNGITANHFPKNDRYQEQITKLAVVSKVKRQYDIFWIGGDGAIFSTWSNAKYPQKDPQKKWYDPYRITITGIANVGADIKAVSRKSNFMDIFWVGREGAIWATWCEGDYGRTYPITKPGVADPLTGHLAVVNKNPDQLDIFWVGTNGAIFSTWLNAKSSKDWLSPYPITAAGIANFGADIQAVSRKSNFMDIMWVGKEGAVWATWCEGNYGTAYRVTEPKVVDPNGRLAVVSKVPEQLDIFWVGVDGAITSTWLNTSDSRWCAPYRMTAAGIANCDTDIKALSRVSNQMEVTWIGVDGSVCYTQCDYKKNNNNWGNAHSKTDFNLAAPRYGSVAAVTCDTDTLDMFWVSGDHQVLSKKLDSNQKEEKLFDLPDAKAYIAQAKAHLKKLERDEILALSKDKKGEHVMDGQGNTALHRAAKTFRLKDCARLLFLGANKDIDNKDGKKPLSYLSATQNKKVTGLQTQLDVLVTYLSERASVVLAEKDKLILADATMRENTIQTLDILYFNKHIAPLMDLAKLATLGLHDLSKRPKFSQADYDSDDDADEKLTAGRHAFLKIRLDTKNETVDGVCHYGTDGQDGKKKTDKDGNVISGWLGVYIPGTNTVFVGGNISARTKAEIKATLVHELVHFVADEVFDNESKPYSKTDAENQAKFEAIESRLTKELDKIDRDSPLNILKGAFAKSYKDNKQVHAELIVRVAQTIVQHKEGLTVLQTQTPDLLKYYTDVFLEAVKQHTEKLERRALGDWPKELFTEHRMRLYSL